MKKISHLLASAVSALAALIASAAAAKTTNPELRSDQPAAHDSAIAADAIVVSQAARNQIFAQARTNTDPVKPTVPKSTIPNADTKPKGKATVVQPFAEAPTNFKESGGFTEFSKGKKTTKSKPGDTKERHEKNKNKKKT